MAVTGGPRSSYAWLSGVAIVASLMFLTGCGARPTAERPPAHKVATTLSPQGSTESAGTGSGSSSGVSGVSGTSGGTSSAGSSSEGTAPASGSVNSGSTSTSRPLSLDQVKALFAGQTIASVYTSGDGALVVTRGGGLLNFTWVDMSTGQQFVLPEFVLTRVAVLSVSSQEIWLLNEGADCDGDCSPFPYLLDCTRNHATDPFACNQFLAYFPVANPVTFGSRPHEELTTILPTMDGVEVAFGPLASGGGNFYADFTTVPPTTTGLSDGGKVFTLTFQDAQLAPGLSVPAAAPPYVTGIAATQSGPNVVVSLTIAPTSAKWFTAAIENTAKGIPFLELRFNDMIYGQFADLADTPTGH